MYFENSEFYFKKYTGILKFSKITCYTVYERKKLLTSNFLKNLPELWTIIL